MCSSDLLSRLVALGKMITGMLPKTAGTGITTEYGSLGDDKEKAVRDLKKLLEEWGVL